MVQIGRRALSIYFKMIIKNRYHANITCFLKNEVSRTPMWTRDFLAPYHNIQIINRRLQPIHLQDTGVRDHNIQIINRRLQQKLMRFMGVNDHNIQIINRRLQPTTETHTATARS